MQGTWADHTVIQAVAVCTLKTNNSSNFHRSTQVPVTTCPLRGLLFLGFGRQSEKFRRIGACIRRNFAPCPPVARDLHFALASPVLQAKATLPFQWPQPHLES